MLLRVSITSFIFILIIFKLRHVAWIFAGDKLVFEIKSNKKEDEAHVPPTDKLVELGC